MIIFYNYLSKSISTIKYLNFIYKCPRETFGVLGTFTVFMVVKYISSHLKNVDFSR